MALLPVVASGPKPDRVDAPSPSPSAGRAFSSLRVMLGLLLLGAAAFKAYSLWNDTAQPVGIFSSLRIQIAVIQIEALLGLWLLSGLNSQVARWVALGWFLCLGAASLYLGIEGESSCGCFGRLKVNPWLTVALDLTAVGALFLWRPGSGGEASAIRFMNKSTGIVAGAIGFLFLLIVGFVLIVDDPWSALARLRGEFITVDPSVSEVGQGSPGEERAFAVNLVNHTDHPVRCIGGTTSCACIATDDLPFTLAPKESHSIQVRIKFRGGSGRFQEQFIVYTDEVNQQVVVARITGHIAEPSQ